MDNDLSLAKKAGKNLKVLIKKLHITQEQASSMLHIEERTLRNWLKNGIDRISTLELICKVFNLDSITTLFK